MNVFLFFFVLVDVGVVSLLCFWFPRQRISFPKGRTRHLCFLVAGCEDFQSFMSCCAGGVSDQEARALFVSMDTDFSGVITKNQLYSETVMTILRARLNSPADMHPLFGAYACLPNPPFKERNTLHIRTIRMTEDRITRDSREAQAELRQVAHSTVTSSARVSRKIDTYTAIHLGRVHVSE